MDAERFRNMALAKADRDYGMCAPPTKAQEGLNILIDHFLGEDWYTVMPVGAEQVNTEAIYQILKSYPKKKSLREKLRIRRIS